MLEVIYLYCLKCISLTVFLLLLSACGGGGSETTTEEVTPLRINAGASIEVDEQQLVTLKGASTGGSAPVTYAWSNTANIVIDHADTSLTDASLTSPVVTQISNYILTLTVTDSQGNQASDVLTLTVNPVNLPPQANIQANQIQGYNSFNYPNGASIQLDGSGSTDTDGVSDLALITSYVWQQIAGPNLLAGIATTMNSIEFVAPVLNQTESATFRLTVTDQEGASNSRDVSLTLLPQSATLPVLTVSASPSILSGELFPLNASITSNAPDAGPFSVNWTTDSMAIIDSNTSINAYATSPLVTQTEQISIQINAQDSFRNEVIKQVNVTIHPVQVKRLNDSGVVSFVNINSVNDNYVIEYPGQDAAYGADRQVKSGTLSKTGDGEQGFDFTRLDNNGNIVSNPSFAFSCVRDNVTGLVWQVKDNQDTTSLNYTEQSFTWFSEEENGNVEGSLNTDSLACNVSNGQCNTQDYVTEMNTQGLCGFFDWRLPKPREIQSIVHYGSASQPLVDQVFFPFLGSASASELWYWTSQSSADGVLLDMANNAWAYDLYSGKDGFLSKDTLQRVILVRAGQ